VNAKLKIHLDISLIKYQPIPRTTLLISTTLHKENTPYREWTLFLSGVQYIHYYSPANLLVFHFADVRGGGTSSCYTSDIWRGCKQYL